MPKGLFPQQIFDFGGAKKNVAAEESVGRRIFEP